VWDRLAYEAQPLELPADLKDKVMTSIFERGDAVKADKPSPSRVLLTQPFRRPLRKPFRRIAAAAVLVLVFFAGFGWRDILPSTDNGGRQTQAAAARIETLLRLEPVAETHAFAANSHAYGVACLIRSEGERQLVVYVFGSPKTDGTHVYHVWLLNNGERRSAGTFTVGSSGIGLLTVPWKENTPSFDTVGVTLEPDSSSRTPQGPKMFGTVKNG
jgi:hypothetical protein